MPLLDEPWSDFADRNPVLPLLLGMLSLSQRLNHLLPEPAAPPSPLPETEEDRLLLMVLGLVSARRTFLGAMEASRSSGEVATPAPDASAAPSLRELLR
ncbi:hypothetical protein COCOR_06212 [Corallococcus coralloides DSM 2259]|uniref:Uncharacterized protein n=1 Tax=Corallococcus coralloides (strain ATCC 25202 / DSM 2259 / NBRC 100086 / M2) TaxID=1144275 RepID=H8MNT1_CORCM|nr:hypothetical protein [Corallococcus coralloides]AFE06811.1 hypothetical protein COCOR_06212 [Corallococcus coralloides DSM 2259]